MQVIEAVGGGTTLVPSSIWVENSYSDNQKTARLLLKSKDAVFVFLLFILFFL